MMSPTYKALSVSARSIYLTHHVDQMEAASDAADRAFSTNDNAVGSEHARLYHFHAGVITQATGNDPRPVV